jgi:hypothetical protein
LHQAVHHFHHVQACAQRAVNGAHFQADDHGRLRDGGLKWKAAMRTHIPLFPQRGYP